VNAEFRLHHDARLAHDLGSGNAAAQHGRLGARLDREEFRSDRIQTCSGNTVTKAEVDSIFWLIQPYSHWTEVFSVPCTVQNSILSKEPSFIRYELSGVAL